jgi:RsiW-degrading membrane proteinase PrsW (M82 family)
MPPLMKYLVVFILIVIIYNLFKAFYHLSNGKSNPKQVVKSLAIRVGLSLALFGSLLLASYLGFIKPHGLLPTEQPNTQPLSIENKKGATQ